MLLQEAELALKILTTGRIVIKRHVDKETGVPHHKVYVEDLVKEVRGGHDAPYLLKEKHKSFFFFAQHSFCFGVLRRLTGALWHRKRIILQMTNDCHLKHAPPYEYRDICLLP